MPALLCFLCTEGVTVFHLPPCGRGLDRRAKGELLALRPAEENGGGWLKKGLMGHFIVALRG